MFLQRRKCQESFSGAFQIISKLSTTYQRHLKFWQINYKFQFYKLWFKSTNVPIAATDRISSSSTLDDKIGPTAGLSDTNSTNLCATKAIISTLSSKSHLPIIQLPNSKIQHLFTNGTTKQAIILLFEPKTHYIRAKQWNSHSYTHNCSKRTIVHIMHK